MSFGIGIGDILMLSGLAYTLGKTLTSGRKGAPAEFQEVQNQLFAISSALKLLSSTLSKSGSPGVADRAEEDEILGRMVENCGATLKHLEKILQKYPELRPDLEKEQVDDNMRRKWRQELKDNIKKIKWTTEGAGLDKLRHNLATHVNALNLAIAARCSFQTDRVKAQVDLTHGMLQDIHEWYIGNIKNAPPKQPKRSREVETGATELHSASEGQLEEPELSFSVFLNLSNEIPSRLLCPKATFDPEWLLTQGSRLFHCVCGKNDNLDYTLLPVSLILRLTTTRPTWKIHAFSKSYNSVVSLLLSNISSTRLADFEQYISQLALIQGLRSASTASNSMLMHTSLQENNRGSLSILHTFGDTAGFRQNIRSATLISNGFQFILGTIDSVQMLYYTTILSPQSVESTTEQENLSLLPCQNAEMVLLPKPLSDSADISQLVLQFNHLTTIEEVRSTPGIILQNITAKASLAHSDGNENHDIHHADIELLFSSREAVNSFVQNPTTNEQRMIIKSKCGSKFVTMVLPPASSGQPLLEWSGTAPDLPAFFIDVNTEETRIIQQSSGIISTLRLVQTDITNETLRDNAIDSQMEE
ncbi:hypothetical protein G7Y89_g988 [Cudoniella acicularis]|uniref:Fungal N-terminal domain-containing protein n=1 Tax=Cudoniella acicularis TaxID=354080 RepID=A0A8H4RW47_9HELO|nr:hypothetical protein G7Y89_g988 [Cudoniella acicularis]